MKVAERRGEAVGTARSARVLIRKEEAIIDGTRKRPEDRDGDEKRESGGEKISMRLVRSCEGTSFGH